MKTPKNSLAEKIVYYLFNSDELSMVFTRFIISLRKLYIEISIVEGTSSYNPHMEGLSNYSYMLVSY